MATTAISSAKVAVIDSGEVGRSAVYSRCGILAQGDGLVTLTT
jgi:hypothetical protein